jgi:hypothetical protein
MRTIEQFDDETITRFRRGGRVQTLTPDRLELVTLRVSVALACQQAGVESRDLPILGKEMRDLARMANKHTRGWNSLVAVLVERLVGK